MSLGRHLRKNEFISSGAESSSYWAHLPPREGLLHERACTLGRHGGRQNEADEWIDGRTRKYIRIMFGQLIMNLQAFAAPLVFATHRRVPAFSRCSAKSRISYLCQRCPCLDAQYFSVAPEKFGGDYFLMESTAAISGESAMLPFLKSTVNFHVTRCLVSLTVI